MNNRRFYLAIPFLLGLTLAVGAEPREDTKVEVTKEKLVGIWEPTKSELPKGSTLEFIKDGKVKLTLKADKEVVVLDGTYVIDGDSLKMAMLIDGKETKDTLKVIKLTGTELALKDDKNMVDEFKRVVPEKK
jgi:uncharacterized protein (TIGR03066 family)